MDFVTGLPLSNGHDAILVVTDRLTKMRHFIPSNVTASASDVAEMYLRFIFKLHGLPDSVVSDRGPQFAAAFWKELCSRLGIQRLLSTAFHPETDGQTERFNAVMECYLRAFVSYQQDDWEGWLALAEFAANNALSEAIGCSPFYANYGYNPRMGVEPAHLEILATPAVVAADDFANSMQELNEVLQLEMRAAQAKYEDNSDASRIPAPTYRVGDEVWLDARHIRTQRPSRKLDWKNLGRFKITRILNPWVYELELPPSMKIHNVFHVSKLSPAATDPLKGQVAPPAPPIEVEGDISYEVEEVLDSKRVQGGHVKYLIKWTGYDVPTWEPASYVNDSDELLTAFHRMYPSKPKATPRGARKEKRGGNVAAQS